MEEKRKDTRLKIRIDSVELDDAIRKARQLKDLLSEIKCLSEVTAEKLEKEAMPASEEDTAKDAS